MTWQQWCKEWLATANGSYDCAYNVDILNHPHFWVDQRVYFDAKIGPQAAIQIELDRLNQTYIH